MLQAERLSLLLLNISNDLIIDTDKEIFFDNNSLVSISKFSWVLRFPFEEILSNMVSGCIPIILVIVRVFVRVVEIHPNPPFHHAWDNCLTILTRCHHHKKLFYPSFNLKITVQNMAYTRYDTLVNVNFSKKTIFTSFCKLES